jgi:hypothetical protein
MDFVYSQVKRKSEEKKKKKSLAPIKKILLAYFKKNVRKIIMCVFALSVFLRFVMKNCVREQTKEKN